MKILIPNNADKFIIMLKRYANLLFADFSDMCSLFKAIREVSRALKEYSQEARKRIFLTTKGSIIWIIVLQSCQFSLGKVNLFYEFTTMHEDLCEKQSSVHHSEIPSELITNLQPDPLLTTQVKNPPPPNNQINVDKIPKEIKVVQNPKTSTQNSRNPLTIH